ncbi:MAG: ATP-dependent DNA helicase RecG [Acidobacteriota bacterium]
MERRTSQPGGPSSALRTTEGLTLLPGITAATARRLAAVGVRDLEGLLWRLPFRYEDRRRPSSLGAARPGLAACFQARIAAIHPRRSYRGGVHLTEAIVQDDTGSLHAVWFNQPWLSKGLPAGTEVYLYGKVGLYSVRGGLRLQLENPEVEKVADGPDQALLADRIVPVYRREGDLHPRTLRRVFLKILLDPGVEVPEVLPTDVVREEALVARAEAFRNVHFPPAPTEGLPPSPSPQALRRLVFEELLRFQWALALVRRDRELQSGPAISPSHDAGELLRRVLPFRLTGAQRRVLREVFEDLASPRPMYRLLHGDVGSGKTVVAFLAMIFAAHRGLQAAYMAPTEVLARQQYLKLEAMLKGTDLRAAFLTSGVKGKGRRDILAEVAAGRIQLLVGTQSLFQEKVAYRALGLVVIDEQHRFGVLQRAQLVGKGRSPNVLVMTATPIPRSLALTLYGDLDLSVLDEMPPGRSPVVTVIRDEGARRKAEVFLRKEMDAGRQVFVVFPLVEESEVLDLQAATEAFARLSTGAFRGYPSALLHGRMKPEEKETVMAKVRSGEVRLLVATTVVEVGVDLPEASVMVVENSERFGLAQLHQLRGRVGRGGQKGYCVLMASPAASPESIERLRVLERTRDGFEIAEADLRLRGGGDLAGIRQWGGAGFRLADPVRDHDTLIRAREWAVRLSDPGRSWGTGERERYLEWLERSGVSPSGLAQIG